jgi:hypothetical protein
MPRYGACWKAALHRLDQGCKQLDDQVQSRLALSFANCFLEKAGIRTYPCEDSAPLADCLANVDNNGFTAYSNFFTQTQNICFFLQSQMWQELTEETVNRLTASSAQVMLSLLISYICVSGLLLLMYLRKEVNYTSVTNQDPHSTIMISRHERTACFYCL